MNKNFPFWEIQQDVTLQIIGRPILNDAKKKHCELRTSLDAWESEIEEAAWVTHHELKERYPYSSILEDDKIFFNIKGNKYRLLTRVNYKQQFVKVEWIGTHAEYTKIYC